MGLEPMEAGRAESIRAKELLARRLTKAFAARIDFFAGNALGCGAAAWRGTRCSRGQHAASPTPIAARRRRIRDTVHLGTAARMDPRFNRP